METKILNGKRVSKSILVFLKEKTENKSIGKRTILYCDNPDEANKAYINQIIRSAKKIGFIVDIVDAENVEKDIKEFNDDPEISGVMFMHPFRNFDEEMGLKLLYPKKDIEGRTENNLGKLFTGKQLFAPPTAEAVMEIIKYYNIKISGKRVVILGRSTTVGKPLAMMMLKKGVDATVTVCHSRTKDLDEITKEADVLVSAIGSPLFVKKEMIKENSIIIDVGFNYLNGKYVGDVDYENIFDKTSAITPVPGGVGSVTTAILLRHIYESFELEE